MDGEASMTAIATSASFRNPNSTASGTKIRGRSATLMNVAIAVRSGRFEAALNVKPAPRITSANGVAIAARFCSTFIGMAGMVI